MFLIVKKSSYRVKNKNKVLVLVFFYSICFVIKPYIN